MLLDMCMCVVWCFEAVYLKQLLLLLLLLLISVAVERKNEDRKRAFEAQHIHD